MHRFLVGDELGNIKSIAYDPDVAEGENKARTTTLHAVTSQAVQVLAVGSASEGSQLLAAGFSDGSAAAFSLQDSDASEIHRWKETRLKDGQRYIGLEISNSGILSCTSNGALRLTSFQSDPEPVAPRLSALPSRLRAWRISPNQETFAYGGDEVDVSVWDTERAFAVRPQVTDSDSKKRKRDALFPGELWRGKNVQNDNLGLRQPLRITSLAYLAPSSASHHVAAGTELGFVRRYDTRTALRPVADWKVGKVGGIRSLEKGLSEHEVFVSDHGSNLYAVDLRNGQVAYGYKGLSGAVTSIAPSPCIMASTCLDRYVRIHTTFPLPQQTGQQQERKGEVAEKIFMKSTPTVVVWDQVVEEVPIETPDDAEDDDVWETMETADVDSDDQERGRRKKR
ncbi:hypothetical protein DXG03_002631 [Asterophora parasitica]|uniref:Ribosome biogenesis protein NSA1 n=1 Tax=Asterophora parasitica TaxID=117018 RepID=A0A9P7GB76_9AGAR|nr:hypothetical protein DXG03_002631 [Asterophora parasitica]